MTYNQHNVPGPEYRVRPVVRYVVTRYCHPYVHEAEAAEQPTYSVPGGSEVIGEFHKEDNAYEVAKSLDAAEAKMFKPHFLDVIASSVQD